MLLGLRTVVYELYDLKAAKEWYTEALGFGPYFDEPFYVGFNVGGYELGLVPAEENAPTVAPIKVSRSNNWVRSAGCGSTRRATNNVAVPRASRGRGRG